VHDHGITVLREDSRRTAEAHDESFLAKATADARAGKSNLELSSVRRGEEQTSVHQEGLAFRYLVSLNLAVIASEEDGVAGVLDGLDVRQEGTLATTTTRCASDELSRS